MLPTRFNFERGALLQKPRKTMSDPYYEGAVTEKRNIMRANMIKGAITWTVITFLFLFYCYAEDWSGKRKGILDEMIITPYSEHKGYVASTAEWVFDNARNVAELLPGGPVGRVATDSAPHQVLSFPKFQSNMYKLTAKDWETYEATLSKFARSAFGHQISRWGIRELKRSAGRSAMSSIPPQIWQTGKSMSDTSSSFQKLNPRSSYNFYDDQLLEYWATRHFNGSLVKQIWDGMERIVLKADFWRYLVLFLEGGFYSDTDTDCLKPIDVWGKVDVVKWDLGDKVSREILDAPPRVVVGIEVDVPDVTGWETFWPRPIQIVQWTMAGAAGHPIYLDSIRRVVESMNIVNDWNLEKKAEADKLFKQLTSPDSTLKERKHIFEKDELWKEITDLLSIDPFDKERGGTMSLIEATGPGAFSDSVFSYLQARYGIHWTQLHNIQTATRIGDVAILPITGFAPFLKPDWQRWKGIDSGPMSVVGDITHPQAMINHHFSGSWRTDEDNKI